MHGMTSYVRREPIGVVAAIVPWNSPLLLTAWKLAPALAAGNTVVLKGSENCPRTHRLIATAFHEAGFPPGVVNYLTNAPADAAATALTNLTTTKTNVFPRMWADPVRKPW